MAAARKLKTKRWNSGEHLKTDEDVVAYFNACVEEGGDDPAFLAHALGIVARARNVSRRLQYPT
jgi:probable addiction module antidote protein